MIINDIQLEVWAQLADRYPEVVKQPAARLDPLPECPICKGLGGIGIEAEVGEPAFGKIYHCLCRRGWAIRRVLEAGISDDTIPQDAYQFDLSDFETLPYADKALQFTKELADTGHILIGGMTRYGIMFAGPTGCGKTTLASCLYRRAIEAGKLVSWWNAEALVKRVQATYADKYEGKSADEIIGTASRVDVLFLDDLGSPTRVTPVGEDHISILLRIINHREAHHLITIITSNLNLQQILAQFGPRIHSRLLGLCAVAIMQGEDFRVKAVGL